MNKMRVLWFSLSPCGSMRRDNTCRVIQGWLISLEDELKKNPMVDLHVAYFASQKEKPFVYDGVTYYPIGYDKRPNPIKRFVNSRRTIAEVDKERIPWMLNVIEQCQPDIIHIHGSEESFISILPYVKRIPIVVSIQGMIAPISEKYFSGIPKNQAFRWDTISERLHRTGIRDQWCLFQQRAERERKYLSQAKYIIGRTFWDYDCTLALNPKRRYYTINEILRSPFYTTHWKGYIDNHNVKFISTLSGGIFKGMETVLKTSHILSQYSQQKYEWHIAGYDKNNKLLRVAEAVAGVRHADVHVILHGQLEAEKLSELLSESDVFVQVSHIENSPNALCEALLVGIPCIASYAGGTASMLANDVGILVQDGDPYVLAGAILNIIQNSETAARLAKSAQNIACKRHNRKDIVESLIKCYQDIINDFRVL